ncbi:MAG: N-acetyl-gamma-glutamyl-phosphate reductase [Myxococcales bacterium]|nr:N-acetyl-gamma-glutamyl-phosphate reductase [Myxococcales bacterium]MDH5306484.1 N-acetyl-gamma-glutamyl-phosphate reductase [Myxococcales bacterium]MDH5565663.1 N-acetyl-gamma-glutamyl-phosphate reductase [Myxococcales bacterium]
MKVAVVGASGYTGLELLRTLLRHPQFEIAAITSEQRAGCPLGDAFPALRGHLDLRFEPADPSALAGRVELAFTALPHAASAVTVRALHEAGVAVADLSADFRLRELETYRAWYGEHPAPQLLGSAVYGLPELYREALRGARLVAVPGCYPTSALIPLVPLLRAGVIAPTGIHIDAKSGVSGAGRTLEADYLFAELDGNCRAYKPGHSHRHAPEIEQEASAAAGAEVRVTFVPHLLPAVRGIVTSVYARPAAGCSARDARAALEAAYGGERFVRLLPPGETPSLRCVRGSNFCDVAVVDDARNDTLVLLSALDNLAKGASGQAVQCANLMCGFAEETGLLEAPFAP